MVQINAKSKNQASGQGAKRRVRGVTLLEILVAVGVMAFAISAIMQIFPVGFSDSARASYLAIAYELAGQKMEEIRGKYIFGGDPDPSISVSSTDTSSQESDPSHITDKYYGSRKYFGHRVHPVKAINDSFSETTMLGSDSAAFVEFENQDGSNVESRYFYCVDMVPMTDVTLRSCNAPRAYSTESPTVTEASWNDKKCRFNFPDCYRITVKVRGPLKEKSQAQNDNWGNFNKSAVEATLVSIISNKEFGIGYLAYDVLCRYVKAGGDDVSPERMWHTAISPTTVDAPAGKTRGLGAYAALDSRSIYVTGLGDGSPAGSNGLQPTKRFYPESFTLIDPARLSPNELWDTGPAIVSIRKNPQPDVIENYYVMRHTASPWESEGSCRKPDGDSSTNDMKSFWLPPNEAGWNDVEWSSSNDYVWNSSNNRYSNIVGYKTIDSAERYIPGGLNLLGQDNVMIIAKKTESGPVYAESNKLVFMVPPHTRDVINIYGSDFITNNTGDYWRFDLLNQIYARDSDCSSRESAYGASRLADDTCAGDCTWASGDGNLIVGGSNGEPVEVNASNLSTKMSRAYYYPRAKFNSSGYVSGTVVRFLMTMPKYSE